MADGPFPKLSQGIRYFEDHETAMNAWVRRLADDNQVEKLTCYANEVWIDESEDGPRIELSGERLTEYLTLCHDAGGHMTWRVDGGYLLYKGTDSRSGRDFNVAFIWRSREFDGAPECSAVVDLRDFGKCVVPLRDGWVLDYEWTPTDFESSREKDVMEVAEDTAEALSNP